MVNLPNMHIFSKKTELSAPFPKTHEEYHADLSAQSPQTKGEYVLSFLGQNKEGFLTRVKLAIQGFFGKGAMGSSQCLANAAKALIKTPADQKAVEAFYTGLKARVSKIGGFDLSQDVVLSKTCIEASLAKAAAKTEADVHSIQMNTLIKIAEIEADTFVKGAEQPGVATKSMESAIKAKSSELATLVGTEKLQEFFEEKIKEALFPSLEKSLDAQMGTVIGDVAERTEAERKKLADLEAAFSSFRVTSTGFFSEFQLNRPGLEEAVKIAKKDVAKATLSLNSQLSNLTKALATLVANGVKEGVDCSSQSALLEKLTALTQDVQEGYSYQSLRELIGDLSALNTFLASKDLKKLSADKNEVASIATQLSGFINEEFQNALTTLHVADGALKSLDKKAQAFNKDDDQFEANIKAQEAMLADQVELDQYAKDLEAYNTSTYFHKWVVGPLAGRGAPLPVETKTGGVAGLMAKEVGATKAEAEALFNYLKPVAAQPKPRSLLSRLSFGRRGQ